MSSIKQITIVATRKASSPKKSRQSQSKASGAASRLEKVMRSALKKLQSLGAEPRLQADIEWCLGSYGYDKNPSGLIEAAGRAVVALRRLHDVNAKSVPASLIKDLEGVAKA